MKFLPLLVALVGYPLSFLAAEESEAKFSMAEFLPAPQLQSSFSTGAGMAGDSGRIYDNRLAQTFSPSQTGRVESVEIVVRPIYTDSPKPLKVAIHKMKGDLPGKEIASSMIRFETIPVGEELRKLLSARAFNAKAEFTRGPVLLGERRFCLVFSSSEHPANYHIVGTHQQDATFPGGEYIDYDRNGVWVPKPDGDLFFRITATPVNLTSMIVAAALAVVVLLVGIGFFVRRSRRRASSVE